MPDYNNLKNALQEMLDNKKSKTAEEEAMRLKRNDEDRQGLLSSIGKDLGAAFQPYMDELKNSSKTSAEEMSRIIAESVKIDAPAFDTAGLHQTIHEAMSSVKMPKSDVIVNFDSSKIRMPSVVMPKEMDIKGWVSLMGVDLEHPLPVQLRDADGRPVNLNNLSQGISGGAAHIVKVSGLGVSSFAEILNPDGRVKVEMPAGSSGLSDIELRASHIDVLQMSGSIDSVYVTGLDTTVALYNADNRLRVSLETGGSGLTDAELRLSHLDVLQLSGSIDSVYVTGFGATVGANILDSSGIAYSGSNPIPVTITSGGTATSASALVDSTGEQYSGSNPVPVTMVTGVSASVNATIVDCAGNYRDTFPISGTVVVSDVTASVKTALIDSSGIQYSGSNPIPTTILSTVTLDTIQVSGSSYSVNVINPVDQGDVATALRIVHAGNAGASVTTSGISRQANPTAVADGSEVKLSADDLGRQLTRPIQVRDLIQTAYATLTTGSETTLRAAVAGAYLDLIYVMGANNSDVAVTVDIRPVTAGNIIMTLQLPANGTAGISCPVPLPQSEQGNDWTADMGDITGTTVYLSALFSQEV